MEREMEEKRECENGGKELKVERRERWRERGKARVPGGEKGWRVHGRMMNND